MEIQSELFLKVISDITSQYSKIHKSKYLEKGEYAIIDQGQNFIAGYTNDKSKISSLDLPLIIFGDHTRVLKYVDFPIAIGADGVKVLSVKKDKLHPLFAYYFLKTLDIPNAGYSRHFKFLKKKKISFPKSLDDQKRIAIVLSDCESLIYKRKESISLLDDLLKSTFIEMFGNPVNNDKKWKTEPLNKICDVGSSRRVFVEDLLDDGIPFFRGTEIGKLAEGQKIKSKLFISNDHYLHLKEQTGVPKIGDLLLPSICPDGRIYMVTNSQPFYFKDGRVLWIKVDIKKINPVYLMFFLKELFLRNYNKIASGATFEELKIVALKKINISKPSITLQNKFVEKFEKIEALKQDYQTHLEELENLYGSLSQQAFKGELNVSKVPLLETISFSTDFNEILEDFKKTMGDGTKIYNLEGENNFNQNETSNAGSLEIPIEENKIPLVSKKDLERLKTKPIKKRDITEISLADYYGIPLEIQFKRENIDFDFISDDLFYQFLLKDHFKDQAFTSQDLFQKLNNYFYNKGNIDFDNEKWKSIIFQFLDSKPPLLKQIFDERDNTVKLKLTDEAYKA